MTGSRFGSSSSAARPRHRLSFPGLGSAGRIALLTLGASLLAVAAEAATYTWNKTASASWATGSNWTPTRSAPASTDILVIDGASTPAPILTAVPTQTIQKLRVINNANATLTATANGTLTITGGTAPNLEIGAGSTLTRSSSKSLSISLTSGATASISGAMVVSGTGHQLLGATAGSIVFQPGSSFTTLSGFNTNAFGSSGTANVVVFSSRSSYIHNAGSNPFGLNAPNSKVVFQSGSTAVYRTTSGFTGDGRTYANLAMQNGISPNANGGSFQFDTLTVENGSSFRYTGSGSTAITIRGDVISAGTGVLTFTGGSGGVVFSGGVVQTIGGGGGTGTLTIGSNGTIASGTTLAIPRTLTMGSGKFLTVNGTLQLNQGGTVSGGANFVYGASGRLTFNNTSGSFAVSSTQTFWPSASGPPNVRVQGAGGITMNTARTVSGLFETSAAVVNGNQLTMSGTLQMNTGGSFSSAPVYSGTATLLYAAGFTVGNEWTAGTAVGSGVPRNVTIQAGVGTVAMPTIDRTVVGNLTITTGTLAMNVSSGNLFVGGDWTDNGTFTPNGRIVTFNGAGNTQTLTRSGTETFAFLAVDKTSGSLVLAASPASNVTVTGASGDVLQLANGAVLNIGANTLTLSGAAGNLRVSGSGTGNLLVTGTGTVAFSGPKTVTATASRTLTFDTGVRVLANAALNFGNNLTTVRGVLEIGAGGSVATNAATYASGATLRYQTGGAVGRGVEWSATSGAGYPHHVEVANGTLDLANGVTGTARQLAGNLTVSSGATLGMGAMTASLTALGNVTVGGTLTLSSASGGDLALAGNLAVTGTINSGSRTVVFQGAAVQTLSGTGGLSLAALRLNKSAGSVQQLTDLTLTAPGAIDALQFNGTTDVLDLNGRTLTLGSRIAGTNAAGALKGSATSSLTLNGSGAAGTLRMVSGSESLANLTLALGGGGSLTQGTALTVNGTLTLTSGTVATGSNTLVMGPAGTVTRTGGHVVGNLRKRIGTGAATATFEIGSSSGYTPVALSFGNVTVAGDLTVSTTNGEHPSLTGSGIVPTRSVNRWYTITNTGMTFDQCQGTFNFLAGDVDGGANPALFEVRKLDGSTWTAPPAGAATATSTTLTGITSFSQFAIGEIATYTVTASAGANGTISPSGAVAVRDRRNQTFTFTPDVGYHITDVVVDGVSQGVLSDYTFDTVVANHTLTVTFSINQYSLVVGVSGAGTVVKDPVQPTYPHGFTVVLTAIPDVGWQFVEYQFTAGFSNPNNPLSATLTQSYVVTAVFVRKPVEYTRTTVAGTYTPITVAGGATQLMASGNDSTRSIPMPFPFVFSGLRFPTSNFLAISANGFMVPSRTSVTSAVATQANNAQLYASVSPNETIAPWYDDLSLSPVGTNPAGQLLYQVQGSPGTRNLTVQWTNASSFATTVGGQPRQINFQAVLFEGTHEIEFRYGPISGSASTQESASIGLEDSLGGNNNYFDGVTGSRVTSHGMLTTNKWPGRFIHFTPGAPTPLSAGTYTVGPGQSYPSLTDAVADLNQRGVAGPVTLQLTAGVHDSSAAGGRNIFPILISRIAGTSAANTVTIECASGTATVSHRGTEGGACGNQSLLTAIGISNEPIIGLVGADYVTLRNLALSGGLAVDRGVLLLPSSTSDGSQNNTLENVSISLSRANNSSVGLQQIVPQTPTDAGGTNSGNRYLNLTVSNVYAGVSLAGHSSLPDASCQVGINPGGVTVIGGPVANDIGNGPTQTFGIRATNQRDVRIFGVEVRNVTGTSTSTVDGIFLDNSGASSASNGLCEVFNNRVHDVQNTSASAGVVTGIRASLSSNPGSVSRIYDNWVYGLNSGSISTTSRRILGMSIQDAGGGTDATHQVDFNSIRLSPTNVTAPNSCFEIGTASGPVMKVRNNVFANFVGTQSGSGKHYCWVSPTANAVGAPGSISDHNVFYLSNLANGFIGLSGGNDRGSLSAWQSATGSDHNSSSANPNFVSAADLHIRTTTPTPVESRASTFGGTIPWAQTDIDGDPRDPSTPDVGADEGNFIILSLNDIGPSAVVAPADGSTQYVNIAFTPQATFENAGTVDQLGIPVRFRIKGPTPATTVVYDQTAVIDTLYAGGAFTAAFPNATIGVAGVYVTEAVAELPSDQNHANDLLAASFEIAGPLNGSYTVGASRPAPFNTLGNALGRLNLVGVSGPVTMLLQDGAYSANEVFPLTITAYPGAGAANPVTIRPAPGVISSITGSSTRAILVLDGADYVTLDGSNTVGGTSRDLTITNNNPSTGSAVIWGQTTFGGDPVRNNTIRNVVVAGGGSTATLIGVGFGAVSINVGSNGVGNHSNTIDNCSIQRTQIGIYSAGQSAANKNTGTVISKNQLDTAAPNNIGRGGILLRFENGPQVTQNRIGGISTSSASGAYGIALGLTVLSSESFVGDEVTNAVVSRNQIRGVAQTHPDGLSAAGITIASATSGTNRLVNNMISGVISSANDPDLVAGILAGGGAGSTTEIYFNSVAMTGDRGNATAPSFGLAVGGSDPALSIRDNIFYNTQTTVGGVGDGYAFGFDYPTPFTRLTSNSNDLVPTAGSPLAVVNGLLNTPSGDVTTLTAWRSLTGRDGSSVSGNPSFQSATDLHIVTSGSPVANAGAPISGITTDFDGDTGSRTSTPDIGADEFGTHTLNLTVVGSGTVAKNPDAANYIIGTVVQLTATPAAGYHFVGWTGDLTGSANPSNLTMNTDKNVTATFAINTYTLSVGVVGAGAVGKSPNQASYGHGSTVTLTATPLTGNHFVSWSGDANGSTNPLALSMTSNKAVTATFAPNAYTVGITVVGSGSVAKSPEQATYEHGSSLTLTATPGPGQRFAGWSGDVTGTSNPLVVSVESSLAITATFEPNTYTVSVDTVGSGIVAKNPDQPTYAEGSQVELTAIPDGGYVFTGWSGDTTTTENPITLTMTANRSVTATFAQELYPLALEVIGEGTVARNPDLPGYTFGADVQLTATPGPGMAFVRWEGDVTGSTNPATLTMDEPKTVTALFTVKLNTTVVGNGSLARSPDQASYDPGTDVQITATPSGGHTFVGWAGDTSGTQNPLTVTLHRTRNITALFTTSLTTSANGGGSVGRNPDQATYPGNSTVTLTATPNAGFNFVSWSGDATGSTNPLPVLMDGNKTITANFANNTYTLVVNTVGNGTVDKNPNQASYNSGSTVTLTAMPAAGYHLVGWSGDASGTTNPLPLLMNANKTVTATFAIDTYTLSVNTTGVGSVAKNPDQPSYTGGSTVQLTATPGTGYHFVDWSGAASGSVNPLDVTMDANKSITANFAPNVYPLTVVVQGSGSVGKSPDQATYVHGSTVTLSATPNAGHSFVNWSGDATGSTTPVVVTMNGPRTVTAVFTSGLVVSVVGSGSVAKSPDLVAYAPGQSVQLTATPAAGYHLQGWSGDASGTTNPQSLVMDDNKSVTATFAINTYTLAVNTVGNGSVAKNPYQPTYDHGSIVMLTANPATGYHFVSWSGDASGSTNPLPVTMDANKSVTATFAINTYTLSLATVGPGTLVRTPDQPTYDHGASVLVEANPPTGYSFAGWSGDASGNSNPLSLTMTSNLSITATFQVNTHTLNVALVGSGAVARNPDQPTYDYGSEVAVTATPAVGNHFVGWSGDASGTTNPLTITIDRDKNLTATFAINTYTLDIVPIGNGSVSRSPSQALYDHGASVQLTATPAVGHHLVGWGGDASGTDNPLTLVMDANKSVTATFAINTYALSLTATGNGTVGKSPDQPLYDHGSNVLLTATPATGHHFVNWSGSANSALNPLSIVMDGEKTVNGSFAINTYSVTVATVGNGTASKSPDQPLYDHGTVVTLSATPAAGHHFVGWSGDTTATTNPLVVTLTRSLGVTATFAIDTYPLSVDVVGSGTVTRQPDQAIYDQGTSVSLTAVPAAGWHLAAWSGDASGATNPITVVMNGPRSVTATFEINTYTLTTLVDGGGEVFRNPGQLLYDHGSTVELTALPGTGYHFTGWSGDATGTQNPVTVTMLDHRSVTAHFEINTYTLSVAGVGGGTVRRSHDKPVYTYGTTVELTASPSPGHHFRDWLGDAFGTDSTITVTMDRNLDITARFLTNTFTINAVIQGGGGTILKYPDLPAYDPGTKVDIECKPAAGFNFVRWTWNPTDTSIANPASFTTDSVLQITATVIAAPDPVLTILIVGDGTVARDPDLPAYPPGTWVQLVATPGPNHVFAGWSNSHAPMANPQYVYMDRPRSMTCTFTSTFLPLTTTVTQGSGTIQRSPDLSGYTQGAPVQLTAVPDPGFHFMGWSGDTSGLANPITVTMTGPKNVGAAFGFATNVTVVGGGSVSRSPTQPFLAPGSTLHLTATPHTGYHFVSWSGDATGPVSAIDVTMDSDKNITATFARNVYMVEVVPTGQGSVSRTPDDEFYEHGTTLRVQATPQAGWHFVRWEKCIVDGPQSGTSGGSSGCVLLLENPANIVVESALQIIGRFEQDGPGLVVEVVGSGSVVQQPPAEGDAAGTMHIVAVPHAGWAFVGWSGDVQGLANPLEIVRDRGGHLTANFARADDPLVVRAYEPKGGKRLVVGETIVLEWTAEGGATTVDLQISRRGPAGPYEAIALGIPNTGSHRWTVTGPEAGGVDLRVVAHDGEGHVGADTVHTEIEPAAGPALPGELALSAPFPNPSPGPFRLEMALPRETRVRVSIMDLQGREVARLIDDVRAPGRYPLVWDGRTERGGVPAGVYFIRLRAEGRDLVHRLHISR